MIFTQVSSGDSRDIPGQQGHAGNDAQHWQKTLIIPFSTFCESKTANLDHLDARIIWYFNTNTNILGNMLTQA